MQSYHQALKPGTILQGGSYTYRIESVLGQGSSGITYLATTRVKVKVQGALGELETDMQIALHSSSLGLKCHFPKSIFHTEIPPFHVIPFNAYTNYHFHSLSLKQEKQKELLLWTKKKKRNSNKRRNSAVIKNGQ